MANVPRVPGVPNLSSYSAVPLVLLVADQVRLIVGLPRTVWGIYLNGVQVISYDSIIAFDYRQDNPISDYQVEQGAFQSYDKIQLPAEIRVRVACGGSIAKRQAFFQSIDEVMNTIDLYDIVTPEKVYLSYNFSHQDFRRLPDQGNGLVTVDLWLTQIRETQQATFTNTQTPSGAGPQNVGNVQPQGSGTVSVRTFSGVSGVQ